MVENCRALLAYSLGRDGDTQIFESALAMIERPLNFNDSCLQVTAALNSGLERVGKEINCLNRFKKRLDTSITPLRVLQTMFRIESASSPPETLSLFVSLSAEIEHLTEKMATLIAGEFQAIENTAATVGSVAAQVRALHQKQVEAAGRRAEILQSVAALELQVEAGKARDQNLLDVAESISQQIGVMVSGLQYQDILNQRLQHVVEGLAEVADHSQRICSHMPSASRADALRFLRDASRIESAQLEGVEETLDGTLNRLRAALEGLARHAADLSCNRAQEGNSAVDTLVRALLDTICENTKLIESTSKQACEISTALQPIEGMLGNLTGSILSLSARIRLISLNAQVQAAQAGEGTGLEVLACRSRTIAEEIVLEVANLADVLSGLKQQLRLGLEEAAAMHARSVEFLTLLQQGGAEQSRRLQKFRSGMTDTRLAVDGQIRRIQMDSAGLARSVEESAAVQETIASTRTELAAFSDGLSIRLLNDQGRSRVEHLTQTYTAATERAAHENALQTGTAAVPLVPWTNPVSPVEGSVELF